MKGYIIHLTKVKEEDLIVTILSQENLDTVYRFYGARHGTINIGFLIDYETQSSAKSTIARLKDVVHIGFKWIHDYKRLKLWQDFTGLFFKHLHDTENISPFYFQLLNESAKKWGDQNPKRVAIETYVTLLEKEGRLHKEFKCFLCSFEILNKVSLLRAFLPAHEQCSFKNGVSPSGLNELFTNKSTLFLNDLEVDYLWNTLLEGL